MIDKIIKRDGRVVPFDKEKITFAVLRAAVAVGGRDRQTAEQIADEVVQLLEERKQREAESRGVTDNYPTVEEVQDAVEKVLIERGHAKTAKAYIVYRYEHTLKRQGKQSLTYSSENVPYKKLWETLSWALDNDCYSLERIRGSIDSGSYADLVQRSEQFYAEELSAAERTMKERLEDLRLVVIAGPSSSGKTTTTLKLRQSLEAEGKRLVPLSVDNYFFDLEKQPEDPHGDYDYETPQALDLELFNDHLGRLLEGETVEIPYYNFKTGRREGVEEELTIGEDDIILLDCLHGLHPPLTESVPAENKFRLYIETLAQVKDDDMRFIRWTDVRMLRRMVRDMQFRNYSPWQTLLHWYLVRRSELRYIVSRLKHADIVMNSFMPSELVLWKQRLEPYFPEFLEKLRDDPERADARDRAERVMRLFRSLPDFDGEPHIPGDSLLREFTGGSTLAY
jgi:uridine kinase